MRKYIVAFFAYLMLLVSASDGSAQQFPRPIPGRLVHDFCEKLDAGQRMQLEQNLVDFERLTSVEFAVVIVPGLQGVSSKSYADGIATEWGVGKAGLNNGLLLLWSPPDRAYYITIADGIREDLSNAQADSLLKRYLVPAFKSENYFSGLLATVDAIENQIGRISWQERQGLRDQRRIEAAQRLEEDKRVTFWLFMVMLGSLVAGLIGIAVANYVVVRKKMSLQLEGAVKSYKAANLHIPLLYRAIKELQKDIPEQDVAALRKMCQERLVETEKVADDVEIWSGKKPKYRDAEKIQDIALRATRAECFLEVFKEEIQSIREARVKSLALARAMTDETFTVDSANVQEGREEGAIQKMYEAEQSFRRAQGMMLSGNPSNLINWLIIYQLLTSAQSQAQDANYYAGGGQYSSSSSSGLASGLPSQPSFGGFGGGSGFGGTGGVGGTY